MTETVTITRSYTAPPEVVYQSWIDVDMLTKWWGCGPAMLWTVHTWNTKVDGEIHVSMDFDGEPYHVHGRFLELTAPRRLRYEWEDGQIITVDIEADGQGSKMTIEHAGLLNQEMGEIVTGGWSASVEQILAVLA